MKRVEDYGQDVPQEDGSLRADRETGGFAAVMQRLNSRSPTERTELANQAEEAVLGYEAYGLGQEYLERGAYAKARQWLQVAAHHGVPGAQEALDETNTRELDCFALDVMQADGSLIPPGAAVSEPHGPAAMPHAVAGRDSKPAVEPACDAFTRRLGPDAVDQGALAQAAAVIIAEQARLQAAELLDRIRRQVQDDPYAARQKASHIRAAAQSSQSDPVDVVVLHDAPEVRRLPTAFRSDYLQMSHCQVTGSEGTDVEHVQREAQPCLGSTPREQFVPGTNSDVGPPRTYAGTMPRRNILCHPAEHESGWLALSSHRSVRLTYRTSASMEIEQETGTV